METYSFLKTGNASEDLKSLYAQGWRLITTAAPIAYAIPQADGTFLYTYVIEYFLERES